jgi:hypothetical protein
MNTRRLQLATCEPYFNAIHGGNDMHGFMVIYSYLTEELYENIWIDELKIYMKRLYALIRVNNLIHPTIRNYNIIIRHMNKLQLVEIITDDTNRETCILHTYKINIFKRIWKKQFYNKLKNKIKYSKL